MEGVSGYFLGIIAVSFTSAVVLSLTKNGICRKYMRLLCGLCGIVCVVLPILTLGEGGEELVRSVENAFKSQSAPQENSVEIYNNSLNSAALENFEQELKTLVVKRLDAKYDDIDIMIESKKNGDDFYIKEIKVILYPSGCSIDPEKIKKICAERIDAPVSFVYRM